MKTAAIIVLASLTGLSAFAQDTKPAAAAAPTAAVAKKVSYKDAKKECLKDNAGMKGKDLQTCIKGKQAK